MIVYGGRNLEVMILASKFPDKLSLLRYYLWSRAAFLDEAGVGPIINSSII